MIRCNTCILGWKKHTGILGKFLLSSTSSRNCSVLLVKRKSLLSSSSSSSSSSSLSSSSLIPSSSKTTVEAKRSKFYNPFTNYDSVNKNKSNNKNKKRILICGDGDLSFGASLALGFKEKSNLHQSDDPPELFVSVLESEMEHNQVYQNSENNIQAIQEHGQKVLFGIDATKLHKYFTHDAHDQQPPPLFDIIQFNFPHWRGKQNNRRNRQLIQDFFNSAKNFIPPGGQIHMALISHQGGMNATNMIEWKRSWMAGRLSGESDLLLTDILPFEPDYNLSSYQWRDKPFLLNGTSEMYIFTKPDGVATASKDIRLGSYFSLFIALPQPLEDDSVNEMNGEDENWTKEQILNLDFVKNVINTQVPEGIHSQLNCWRLHFRNDVTPERKDNCITITAIEYRVYLFGAKMSVTASNSTKYKERIEDEVQRMAPGTKTGAWSVSNVIPSKLLFTK